MKISYADKTGTVPKQTHENQWWDDDANEVKTTVNTNWIQGLKRISGGICDGMWVDNKGADRTSLLSGDIVYGAKAGFFDGDYVIVEVKNDNPTTESTDFYNPYVRAVRMDQI